jgi:bacterioferritin
MDREKIVKALNEALAQEHGCNIRYSTHAAVVSGPYAEAVANRLKEIAKDEQAHADKLRDRITALGGVPTMDVAKEELIPAKALKEILAVNLKEEAKAINHYQSILKMVDRDDIILYEVIEDIIEDEQEHREELSRLQE